ncbi:MAG: hypothetical protein HZB13_02785 [Acidobacteria bacterium]|nr:hypothetical protein [Acidobacteriota bacterium]
MLTFAFLLLMQQAPAAAPAQPTVPAAPLVTAAPAPAEGTANQRVTSQAGPELLQIKNVYILGMGSQFDQFLADHVARGGVLQVVTDPAKADAILTERLGKGFEKKLEELYPTPKPEPPPTPKAKDEDSEDTEKSPSAFDLKTTPQDRTSSLGRGKGTVFLVHRSSRSVVWSTYERPKSTRPDDLNSTAREVAGRLEKAIEKAAGGQKKPGFRPW